MTRNEDPQPAVILSPLDAPAEVAPLAAAGAGEFYAGLQPRGWRHATLSASQRSFAAAHFPSESALAEAVAEARHCGIPLHLALNAPWYDADGRQQLLSLAARAVDWGVSGVIVGDLGLLRCLAERELPLSVTLSTMAGATNRWAVRFYRRFGIRRAVLPRHLTLAEMTALAAAFPELCFEAFILIGRCPNQEAYCSFQHCSPTRRWPCEVPYQLRDAAGATLASGHPLHGWHDEWAQVDRRWGCGLCAIPQLLAGGIRHWKLVGRGGPTAAKVGNVELVTAFAAGEGSAAEARAAYRERFGTDCARLACYYPELHPATRSA